MRISELISHSCTWAVRLDTYITLWIVEMNAALVAFAGRISCTYNAISDTIFCLFRSYINNLFYYWHNVVLIRIFVRTREFRTDDSQHLPSQSKCIYLFFIVELIFFFNRLFVQWLKHTKLIVKSILKCLTIETVIAINNTMKNAKL